jgi:UDP-N-acetylglucosamine 2-epimerase
VLTDHVSDLLLAATPTAMRNLATESLGTRAVFTGDVMYDAVLHALDLARQRSRVLAQLALEPLGFGVVTLHRAENTTTQRLAEALNILNQVAEQCVPLVFPVHPRTAALLRSELSGWRPAAQLSLVEPLGYLDMLRLTDAARLVLTDSGGLQKEAFFLGCPCITLRTETEWVETVEAGGNVVTGVDGDAVLEAARRWMTQPPRPLQPGRSGPFGDGHAADAVAAAVSRLAA